jgi:hypothetical protein
MWTVIARRNQGLVVMAFPNVLATDFRLGKGSLGERHVGTRRSLTTGIRLVYIFWLVGNRRGMRMVTCIYFEE